jgi:hypothetical protein
LKLVNLVRLRRTRCSGPEAAGAEDNGGPGERLQYHPGYYGAYPRDPDGNIIEAVFHDR